MATNQLGHGEVKSIEDKLECSPSQSQGTSPIYKGSSRNPSTSKTKAKTKGSSSGKSSKFGAGRNRATG